MLLTPPWVRPREPAGRTLKSLRGNSFTPGCWSHLDSALPSGVAKSSSLLCGMTWISGTQRGPDGRLYVATSTKSGEVVPMSIGPAHASLSSDANLRGTRTLDLSTLQIADGAPYLACIGLLPKQELACGQAVYIAEFADARLWIPAQLLILSFFGAWEPMRARLLQPCGLDFLAEEMEGRERWVGHLRSRKLLKERVQWITRSSALSASWASVYHHALAGRLAWDCPALEGNFAFAGISAGRDIFVTRLTLAQVQTKGTTRIVLDKRWAEGPWGGSLPLSCVTVASMRTGKLTDEQWECVEPILTELLGRNKAGKGGAARKHDLRGLLDAVVEKLELGLAWTNMPGDKNALAAAAALLARMRNYGVWDRVAAELAKRA